MRISGPSNQNAAHIGVKRGVALPRYAGGLATSHSCGASARPPPDGPGSIPARAPTMKTTVLYTFCKGYRPNYPVGLMGRSDITQPVSVPAFLTITFVGKVWLPAHQTALGFGFNRIALIGSLNIKIGFIVFVGVELGS